MPITVTHHVGRDTYDWEQIVWEAAQAGSFSELGGVVTLTNGSFIVEFTGTGLLVNGIGTAFTAGTITGMVIKLNSTNVVTIAGLNADFEELNTGLETIALLSGTNPYYTQAFKDAFLPLYEDGVAAIGSSDKDTLLGGVGDDTLNSGDGDDYIDGGNGFNDINAGGGDDYVQASTGTGPRTGTGNLNGGQNANQETQGRDFDILAYEFFGQNNPTTAVTIDAHLGQTIADLGAGSVVLDYFHNFEHYVGTQSGDIFIGSTFQDWFTGMAGTDTFYGNGGDDSVDYDLEVRLGGTSGVIVDLTNQTTTTDSFGSTDNLFGIENIRGTEFDDTITGDNNRNRLEGGDGVDILNGGGGNDELRGGAGADILDGGDGEDNLNGGAGDDTINAGAGRFDKISGSTGEDIIDGQAGYDELTYSDDLVESYVGTDALLIELLNGVGTGIVQGVFDGLNLGLGTDFSNMEQITGSRGNDAFTASESITYTNTADAGYSFGGVRGAGGVITFIGGMGNDTYYIGINDVLVDYDNEKWLHLNFNDENDRRWGQTAGENGVVINMSITDRTQADAVWTGGNYSLLGGQALDTFGDLDAFSLGVSNLISVRLTDAADIVWANANGTYAEGKGGNDQLFGGIGDDEFQGNDGDDTLHGGAGQDRLNGQNGNDTINGESGHDNINGDDGDDTITGGDGIDNINGGNGIDNIAGDAGRDYVNGENDDDVLSGGADNDEVEGGDGADQVFGDAGNDNVRGGNDADLVSGGDGDDQVDGENGEDFVEGGNGNDEVRGGNDADRVLGNSGDDRVQGGDGNDILSGDDTFAILATEAMLIAQLAAGVITNGGNDRLWGDSGNDLMFGGYGHDELQGGDNDDKLYGGIGNDRLQGDNGVDALNGGDGDDQLDGGAGIDNLKGDAGSDYLYGGSENDTLTGGAGLDSLEGGFGNDTYVFTLSDAIEDNIYDEGGIDLIQAASNVDMFRFDTVDNLTLSGTSALNANGNNLANIITGNGGVNILEGRGGHDTILGGIGNDTLRGEVGNDTLNGGAGQDKLYGGTGTSELDVFTYTAIADSGITATTRDIIYDFHDGKDKINLSAIDANTSVAGNGAFGVLGIGTATSAVAAGKIGWYQVNSTNNANDRTFLRINTDADATIEMTIELVGLKTITTADFVL